MPRTLLLLSFFLLVMAQFAFAEEPLRTTADRAIDVHHIRLEVDVDLHKKTLSGTATIDFSLLRSTTVISLDAVDHEVHGSARLRRRGPDQKTYDVVVYNTGKTLQINLRDRSLLNQNVVVRPDEKWRLEIDYSVRDPRSGLYFFGPTEDAPDTPLVVWSQGEPTGNRFWFPCVDNPNERQSTEMIVTVDKKFEVLSNGKLVSRKDLERDRVQFHWSQEKSHVSYLVSLVIGEFDVTREEWRGKPVTYYVPKNRAADTQRTFGRTTRMLDFFSERFGIEYPWEKYAQVVVHQFVFGGMENTSATTLYGRAMHDERAMLDSTPDWLIAHELGHQWWGDLVTCKDWSHLWLNEGFATYSEILWDEYAHGRDERDWHLLQDLRAARSGTTLSRPVLDRRYRHPGSMFDNRVYPKGAWVLHMLRSRLGDDDFFRGLQRYGTVYAYQSAETSDLRQVFERLYGVSLERFFYDWTERPGHPELLVESEYLPAERKMKIHVKQTQKGDLFHIPVRIEFSFDGPNEGPSIDRLMTEREFTEFLAVPQKPRLVRVDPDFTLLARIQEKKERGLWEAQLSGGPRPGVAERVRAAEHFAEVRTDKSRELLQKSLETDPFWGVRTEAAKALGKLKGDIARDALIEGLAQEQPKVRRACADALKAFANDSNVVAALTQKSRDGDASYFVESSVLSSLAEVSSEPPVKLLTDALDKPSHRETIRLAALSGLARSTDKKVLDVLFDWTQPDKPHVCRHEAIRRLVEYVNRNELDASVVDRVVRHYLDLIDRDGPRLRGSLASGLGQLGSRASAAESRLEQLAESDPYDATRDAAGKALEKIRTSEPGDSELARLRREVEDARKRNRELEQRLLKLESK
jgi:aminopeptidase N